MLFYDTVKLIMNNDRYAWGEEDLEASVLAYIEMKRKYNAGEPFSKKSYYQQLGEQFGRSLKSFEYRMQNISYAYLMLDREWLKGLKPASHVGSNKLQKLIELICLHDDISLEEENQTFEHQVEKHLQEGVATKPTGNKSPIKVTLRATTVIRDPKVKAFVLQQAKGFCESCEKNAPFLDSKGNPYLEVHHVKHLADGGSDTVENAVAVCPNCHRELHYSPQRHTIIASLYNKISRLIKE